MQKKFESHIRSLGGDYNLLMVSDVYIDVETQIEWRTWQEAWQAALASQKPEDDGWIEWGGVRSVGRSCPVDPEVIVELKLRDGTRSTLGRPAGTYFWGRSDITQARDIIAYRVLKP